jgi:hypothetical protein
MFEFQTSLKLPALLYVQLVPESPVDTLSMCAVPRLNMPCMRRAHGAASSRQYCHLLQMRILHACVMYNAAVAGFHC